MKNLSCHKIISKLLTLLLLAFTKVVFAQTTTIPYETLYTNGTFNSKATVKTLAVGSLLGEGVVSSGVASYSIPIAVPAGTNGVIPTLSINYSSMNGNGQLGMGWGLSGMSAITTTNDKNLYYDGEVVEYTKVENFTRFYLDGKRLILSTTGTYPEDGTGKSTYTTENDVNTIITFENGYFKVVTTDGVIMEYGNTADSKFNGIVFRLNKIIYPNSNYIEYIYDKSNNDVRISEIKYTGNTTKGLAPYNSIKFNYLDRSDKNFVYNSGVKFESKVLLDNILIKTNDINTASTDKYFFKKYQLKYGLNNNISYLNEIQEIGLKTVNSTAGTYTEFPLNSTIFKYGDDTGNIGKTTTDMVKNDKSIDKFETGDFNGDGYGDILTPIYDNATGLISSFRVYAATDITTPQNFSLFGVSDPIPSTSNSRIANKSVSLQRLGLRDFNGDGLDDVILANISFNSPNIIDNFTVYKSALNPSGTGQNRITFSTANIAIENTAYTFLPTNQQYLHIGDFNGDGITDIFTIFRNTPNQQSHKAEIHISNPTTPATIIGFTERLANNGGELAYDFNTLAQSENINVIDFNGDGKSDIIFIKGTNYYVFTFEKVQKNDGTFGYYGRLLNRIYSNGGDQTFTANCLTYFGDFNGDRKTDVLFRTSLTDNNASWKIRYSKGNGFSTEEDFNFSTAASAGKPYLNTTQQPPVSAHILQIGDFNGDGMADIYHARTQFNRLDSPLYFNIYYSTGRDFNLKLFNDPGHTNGTPSMVGSIPQNVFDYNGDGRSDIMLPLTHEIPIDIFSFNNNSEAPLLQKVKNGLEHVTEWTYKGMNTDVALYSRSRTETYPYNVIKAPLKVVSEFKVGDGIGGTATKYYKYENALIHRAGRGFLGFEKITISDFLTNIKIKSENILNSTYGILLPQKETVTQILSSTDLSKSTITTSLVDKNNKRYRADITSTEQINYLEEKSSTTDNIFNTANGTLTESITKMYGGRAKNKLIEQVTTSTTYDTFAGASIPNRPISVTASKDRYEGASTTPLTSAETKTFEYNTAGELTKKVDFSGKDHKVTTTYTRDDFGNVLTTSVTPNLMTARSVSDKYDTRGRFVTEHTNVLGQKSTTEYDEVIGKPKSMTGVDGLTTSFEYDVFGRLTKTTLPEGYDITQEKGFTTTTTQYAGSLYYNKVLHPGKPDITTYYDMLGREVGTKTEGFGSGVTISSYKTYNNKGKVEIESNPHHGAGDTGSDSYFITTNTYDDYNRLVSSNNQLGTSYINYSFEALTGLATVAITERTNNAANDPTNKVTKKISDATGKVIQSIDDAGTQNYSYNAQGNILSVTGVGNVTLTTSEYDDYGRQTKLTDISAGVTTYTYNAAGELITEKNAKNDTRTMTYDNFGRITKREGESGKEGATTTEYYTSNTGTGAFINKVKKITGFAGETTEMTYDAYGRVSTSKQTIDGIEHSTSYTYNTYGDILTKTFPSGFKLNYDYDGNGYLKTIKNGNNSVTIYTHASQNAAGQVKTYSLGNGKASANTYYYGIPTNYTTSGIQNLDLTWEYTSGNLLKRKDNQKIYNGQTLEETFTYDRLNRLTSTTVIGQTAVSMNYSNAGNIDAKTDVGTYNYVDNSDPSKPKTTHQVRQVTTNNGSVPILTQNINFSSYERPTRIEENGFVLNYTYDAGYQRIKGVMTQGGNNLYTHYYFGDYEKTIDNGVTRELHYISSPAGLIAIVERVNNTDNYHYTYTDHLGSILTVTNSNGAIEKEQSFDAWGRRRDSNSWILQAATTSTGLPWLYRGFTGHEHLDQFGLINMNARLYDPVLGRMISPDNFVNGAFDSQGYNRYSYARNNPLSYVDPDGNNPISLGALLVHAIQGALISAAVNVAVQVVQNGGFNNFDWNSVGMAALQGAVGAAFSFGIGELGLNPFNSTVAHAVSGGIQSAIFGGNFWQGAVSGTIGSVLGRQTQGIDAGLVGNFVIAGSISAITASVIGGDPFQSFVTGGAVAAFNHYLHGPKRPKNNELNPSTIRKNTWWIFGRMTYAGANNPKTYGGDDDFSFIPDYEADYPAIGHDRRYTKVGAVGKDGLLYSEKTIGADIRFVLEEGVIATTTLNPITKVHASVLGLGLGLLATGKTLYHVFKPNGFLPIASGYNLAKIYIWYKISNEGVTNNPSK
jgi:RHS repeat-associated protein